MTELFHRVRVFPYALERREPSYLLLLREQGLESCWGPIQGEIGHGEQMEGAIRRQVHAGMGLEEPLELVDLHMPARWILGDEEVIEWSFGCRIPSELNTTPDTQLRWESFVHAYPTLELETDRAAILRLHALLRAA